MAANKQFLTCSFQLHDPSARKKAVLDFAFEQYTLGASTLLEWAKLNMGLIKSEGRKRKKDGEYLDKWDGDSVRAVVPSSGAWSMPIGSSVKEALIADVSASLASYLELRKTDANTGFPTAFVNVEEDRRSAYDFWCDGGNADEWDNLVTEDDLRAKAKRRSKSTVRPIAISRSRDFALLLKPDLSGLYAWLPILPADNGFLAEPLTCDGSLINIATGEPFVRKSKTAVLVPVELGIRNNDFHWQFNEFIVRAIDGQASIQSAKLIRLDTQDGYKYKLNVSFAFVCPDVYKPDAYLGIDRGILFSVAYGVVDLDGRIVAKGHYEDGLRQLQMDAGKRVQRKQEQSKGVTALDYKRKAIEEIIHKLVNHVVELAKQHRAAIVLEDLNVKVRGRFVKSAWKKIGQIIGYKANLAGVPVYGEVFAAYSSLICIHCGGKIIEHKRDGSPVVCSVCGSQEHADEAAGINIARRAMYRKRDWEGRGGYMAFHKSFSKYTCRNVSTLPTFQAKNELRKSASSMGQMGLFA